MKLTKHQLKLLDGMIEIQKNHAERCRQLKGSVSQKQRKKDLERVEILKQIKSEKEVI